MKKLLSVILVLLLATTIMLPFSVAVQATSDANLYLSIRVSGERPGLPLDPKGECPSATIPFDIRVYRNNELVFEGTRFFEGGKPTWGTWIYFLNGESGYYTVRLIAPSGYEFHPSVFDFGYWDGSAGDDHRSASVDVREIGAPGDTQEPVPSWHETLPAFLQFILRWVLFGWIWL